MFDPMRPWFNYPIQSFKVTDGDTVKVALDLGFYLNYHVKVRLAGLDTPETRLTSSRAAGTRAKEATQYWLDYFTSREEYQLIAHSTELVAKYHNRILGDIIAWQVEGPCFSLCDYLLYSGLAKAYDGRRRDPWGKEALARIVDIDYVEELDLHTGNSKEGLDNVAASQLAAQYANYALYLRKRADAKSGN